jgi:hypothetical protein
LKQINFFAFFGLLFPNAKLAEARVEQIFRRRLAFRLVVSSRKATSEINTVAS